MKSFLFVLSLLLIVPFSLFSQYGNMSLTFKAFDNNTNLPLLTDSILIINQDKDCDTVLYGSDELYIEWTDGIDEKISSDDFAVGINRANPFKGTTAFVVSIKKRSSITTSYYDATGSKLKELKYNLPAGLHSFSVSAGKPGLYFVVINNGSLSRTLKLINIETGNTYGIAYSGQSGEQKMLKNTTGDGIFEFYPGDSLSYTVFSNGYEPLTITDAPSEDSVYDFQMKPNLIDFTADTTSGYVPLSVQFYGITNMNIQSWHWDFGDGTTSDLQNPAHIYMEQSTYYTVELKVIDDENITHIVTKEGFIHTISDPASVNFTADVTAGFSPLTVHFTGYANFQVNYWQWSFGDGQTANVQNPTVEFIYPGVYTVTLEVFSNNGSVSETKENYIHIGSCPPVMQDNDGNTYETILIGNQCWMKSNINVGTRIDKEETGSNNAVIEKYCYNDDEDNCDEYGGFYNYNETMQYYFVPGSRGLCPDGWHIPTDNEWYQLSTYLGGDVVAGGKMKEEGYEHWKEPNTGATNSSDFTALGSGFLWHFAGIDFTYLSKKEDTFFRSSDYGTSSFHLWYGDDSFGPQTSDPDFGYSVRCIKDIE